MKKNLISVIILALLLVNLVLTALLMFTMMPATKNANTLISQVASAIDLELTNGTGDQTSTVPIENIEVFNVPSTADEKMTINLKAAGDGKDHFAIVVVSLSLDKTSEAYKTFGSTMTEKESLIRNEINAVISSHSITDLKTNNQAILDEILESVQTMFGKDGKKLIVGVGFRSIQYQ